MSTHPDLKTSTPLPASVCPAHDLRDPGILQIRNRHAEARVSLHGGQVLAFRPLAVEHDLLFLSERAVFQPGKAIRGGVPVCWPWFGPDPQNQGRPAHGLARTRAWALRSAIDLPDGATRVTLGLTDTAETRALWPHAFDLSLCVTVGAELHLALTTCNTGDTPFTLTQALHSYFSVADIARAEVRGLDGLTYLDKAAGAGGAVWRQTGAVVFGAEVDRIYTSTPPRLALRDEAWARTIELRSEGSRTAVVWNPGAAIAAGMADLADDAYRRFVCVETANAADEVITLLPGQAHTMAVTLGVQCDAGR